jgi:hypothetical protein
LPDGGQGATPLWDVAFAGHSISIDAERRKEKSMLVNLFAAAVISVMTMPGNAPPIPGNKGPAIIPTTLAFGAIDPTAVIPTVDGVSNAGVDNWDIAWPLGMLARGTSYAETFSFHDISYSGDCEFLVTIKGNAGGQVAAPVRKPISCTPGDVIMVSTQTGALGGSPGAAEATLTVYFGKKKTSIKVPLVIQ